MSSGTTNESYTFDGVGNRTASHRSASYSYQPFNRVTATATASYSYDANGNMTTKAEPSLWRYSWDYENRLASASTRKLSVRYHYDALGRRVRRILGFGREDTKFIYDGLDVVMDDDTHTGITKYQNGLGTDDKLKLSNGGVSKYFLQDHLGSTVALTNTSGAVTEQTSYDSFGNSTPSLSIRYQYSGREYDSFTGLTYYRARWYDSNLGRFISADPFGFVGGPNLYTYVGNKPISFTDPLGLFPSWGPFNYHGDIVRRALQGIATPEQIDAIANANAAYDARTQDPIYAPYHAMRRPGQSIEEAREEANEFVRFKICAARRYSAAGMEDEAMNMLGQATHTLQDAESPSHAGFQEAWPTDLGSMIENIPHYVKETFIPGWSNLSAAENATKKAWDYYKGEAMPSNFFPNTNDHKYQCPCP